MTYNTDLEEGTDRLLAMRQQEEVSYCYRKYNASGSQGSREGGRVNVAWREKICQWSYNVVDHFELSREVVAVSMSLFDRYFATRQNKCNGNMALLTSLTTLHIAIKLHETKKIKLSTLANLSRGQFDTSHIEEMERQILNALAWKVHPPTQYAFLAHYLLFLPPEANASVRKEILELSRYLSELAVCDSYFVDVNNSTVALASILCVMEDISYTRLSAGLRETFLLRVSQTAGIPHFSRSVIAARERLRTMFSNSAGQAILSSFNNNSNNNNPSNSSNNNNMAEDSTIASTMSSGSNNTASQQQHFRNRTNSMDSKGSCRYSSASPRRRFVASVSPMSTGRSHLSSSPIVAGVQ